MRDPTGPDFISDLPQSIIESILTRLPIRDAVRTSILSSKWRYKWATITQLVFNDKCVALYNDQDAEVVEKHLIDFITRALFLHKGPIHKFELSSACLPSCPDVDQWILFLSRNGIKELVLDLEQSEWFRIPSCLFQCRKLTHLELCKCEFDPPSTFKGFASLKSLKLHQVLVSPDVIESLISSCPLLESLEFTYADGLALSISAPNLKYLCLDGEFKDISLENTQSLVELFIDMYVPDYIANHHDQVTEYLGQSSSCKFTKFLGKVPLLEKLTGKVYFTKYLSIGLHLGRQLAITYNHLKFIELGQVNFEDEKEILVVLLLINSAPNLEEFQISPGSPTPPDSLTDTEEADDLNLWEKESLLRCKFEKLRVVKMKDMCGFSHEMELIKFLLSRSSVLETMYVIPSVNVINGRMNILIELVRFRRASAQAEILFIKNKALM
ncbi:hypothetical protein UlMin_040966 [Ulmus minor]